MCTMLLAMTAPTSASSPQESLLSDLPENSFQRLYPIRTLKRLMGLTWAKVVLLLGLFVGRNLPVYYAAVHRRNRS